MQQNLLINSKKTINKNNNKYEYQQKPTAKSFETSNATQARNIWSKYYF